MPFGAGFVVAFVVLPAFLGCDVEDDVLTVVLTSVAVCGRYYSLFDKQQVAPAFPMSVAILKTLSPGPDYSVTPDTMQPVIRRNRETGEREWVMMRWEAVRPSGFINSVGSISPG
jgi:hypothetical protein